MEDGTLYCHHKRVGSPIRIADLLRKVMAFTLRTPSKSAAPLFSLDFCVRDTPRWVIAVRGKVRADIPGTCFGERDFSFLRRKAVHVEGEKAENGFSSFIFGNIE